MANTHQTMLPLHTHTYLSTKAGYQQVPWLQLAHHHADVLQENADYVLFTLPHAIDERQRQTYQWDKVNLAHIKNLHSIELAAFDMDSTLIDMECIDQLAHYAGCATQVAAITRRAMLGELDFAQSLTQRLELFAGVPASIIQNVLQDMRYYPGVEKLFAFLRERNIFTLLVSGGFEVFAQKVARDLGLNAAYAHCLDIADDGASAYLTGKLAQHPHSSLSKNVLDGAMKAQLIQETCQAQGIDVNKTLSVGDGANDIPMMRSSTYSVAHCPKPALRSVAGVSLDYCHLDAVIVLSLYSEKLDDALN